MKASIYLYNAIIQKIHNCMEYAHGPAYGTFYSIENIKHTLSINKVVIDVYGHCIRCYSYAVERHFTLVLKFSDVGMHSNYNVHIRDIKESCIFGTIDVLYDPNSSGMHTPESSSSKPVNNYEVWSVDEFNKPIMLGNSNATTFDGAVRKTMRKLASYDVSGSVDLKGHDLKNYTWCGNPIVPSKEEAISISNKRIAKTEKALNCYIASFGKSIVVHAVPLEPVQIKVYGLDKNFEPLELCSIPVDKWGYTNKELMKIAYDLMMNFKQGQVSKIVGVTDGKHHAGIDMLDDGTVTWCNMPIMFNKVEAHRVSEILKDTNKIHSHGGK